MQRVLINRNIRAKEVRLIDQSGQQVGIVPLDKALSMASERGLDLVQVTEKTEPPVCKITEYGKYLYQLRKKEKKRMRQKGGEIKGVRLNFNTSTHDLETKAKQAHKFLTKGNKVKIDMRLRGREKALREHSQEQINKFLTILKGYLPIEIDQPIKREPIGMSLIIKKGKNEPEKQIKNEKILGQKV